MLGDILGAAVFIVLAVVLPIVIHYLFD